MKTNLKVENKDENSLETAGDRNKVWFNNPLETERKSVNPGSGNLQPYILQVQGKGVFIKHSSQ